MRVICQTALLLFLGCVISQPCCAQTQNGKEPSVTAAEETKPPIVALPDSVVTSNVAYVTDGDVLQTLDIYAPKAAANAPVVVFVHGGGWNKRDKDEVGSQPKLFNAAGIIVVSINYRLVPAVTHPENVRDVAAAIAWISKNIAKHGGDPGRIFVMGHSAGSHLAALVATDDRYLAAHGLHRSQLAGVISLDGSAFDIPDRVRNGSETIAENCRRAFGNDEKVQQDGSPVNHVQGETGLPPFLLIYLKVTR
ncbi:MAG: alpha/beta hydrolase [Planctomycetaceae bacterium]